MTKVACWNTDRQREPWRELLRMDADIALLQEACKPPAEVAGRIGLGSNEHWDSQLWNSKWYQDTGRGKKLFDRWTRVVKLSDRVDVEWFKQVSPIGVPKPDEFPVSGIGTVAAARVTPRDAQPFIVVSMYARWMAPHPSTNSKWGVGYADGSAHRIISDLSVFIGDADPSTHRILAAGDLNIVDGSQTGDPQNLEERSQGVFSRMDALGLAQVRLDGRQAEPRPAYLPPDTPNVPTYYTTGERQPADATKQLDYVFASKGFHRGVSGRAMNGVEEWGPSDHCRLLIKVGNE